MQAKREGLPLSALTIHTKMRDQDYTDLTFEDEIAQLQLEKDLGITDLLTPVNPVLENLAVEEPPIDPDSEQ